MTRHMKFIIFLIIMKICAVTITAEQKIDGIAAIIGDSVILVSELDAFIMFKSQENKSGVTPESMKTLRKRYIDELIDGKVLLVRAEKDTNIIISDQMVNEEVSNRIQYILQKNNLSKEQFKVILKKEQGVDFIKFKKNLSKQIKQEILQQKVQQLYAMKYSITKPEVEQFFNEFKDSLPNLGESLLLSQIVVDLSASNEVREQAYQKISQAKELLDKSTPFEKVAQKFSEGPNAQKGGDLGFIKKGSLTELVFEEKIFSLKPGEISEPFESRIGFHIVNVVDRQDQKVHAKQIFINTNPSQEEIDRVKQTLDSIKTNCKKSEQFKVAVEKFSSDEASKARKGLLKWRTTSSLDSKFKSLFDTLTIGAISKPLQIKNSYAIFRIEDLKSQRHLTLEDDWFEISQIAKRVLTQKKLVQLVKEWKKTTFIDIRL